MEAWPDVLVVEDDEDDIWVLRRAFLRHQMEGRLALVRTGEEALRYLRESSASGYGGPVRPKVVFLDLKLPGISGLEVLRRIRAHEDTCMIPVVIVSSSRLERDVCESYRMGANSFVSKQYGQVQPGEYMIGVARYWLNLNQPAHVR